MPKGPVILPAILPRVMHHIWGVCPDQAAGKRLSEFAKPFVSTPITPQGGKSQTCSGRISPDFAKCLSDLESRREGKTLAVEQPSRMGGSPGLPDAIA